MRFYTHSHPYYCGIDLHARTLYVCIIDDKPRNRSWARKRGPYLYAMAKYTDDEQAANDLWLHLTKLANKCWRLKKNQGRVLALLSIQGQVWGVHCPRCHGRGNLRNRLNVERECNKCGGTGKGSMKKSDMARMLNISRAAFGKTWDNRLAISCSIISEYDYVVDRHVKGRV